MAFREYSRVFACALAFVALPPSPLLRAQNLVRIDASAPLPLAQPVKAHLGTNRSPQGHVLSVNSQYLTMDGKPWLPVMGELHYSRLPESEWESSILKMKAGGVDIIASYVIWLHHEQEEGVFDWKGQKDLRRFAQLCAKHGMYFYPRIGPWAHAEVRNGGMPDWVLAKGEVRKNNPQYLLEVQKFYAEIGKQLKGLYWKDGGPIIGIQIENEYRGSADHIRGLKKMALAEGMDVPLYTVTGWDKAAIPLEEVLPVFGGYPDAPWDPTPTKLPPADVYAFRFANRAGGSMGAIGTTGQSGSSVYEGTPFLTAEVGGGIQDTYYRRPVVSADDVTAMIPVMLGSGANLIGYYMFHGGRNPDGKGLPLQESQSTGYPTDVPKKSYDFQAPLSPDGEERESFHHLKLIHYFLQEFGSQLATMTVRAPEQSPSSPADLSMPRVAARMSGDSGFLFFNNYVRGVAVPERKGFAAQIRLPQGSIQIPETPIDLPSNSYGIWPINLDLHGLRLRYSTAQLITHIEKDGQEYYFFSEIEGVRPEISLDLGNASLIQKLGFEEDKSSTRTLFRAKNGLSSVLTLQVQKRRVHLVFLPMQQAVQLWRIQSALGLVRYDGQLYAEKDSFHLIQNDNPSFEIATFHGTKTPRFASIDQLFHSNKFSVPESLVTTSVVKATEAKERKPWQPGAELKWRKNRTVMAPDEEEVLADAALWNISLQTKASPALSNIFLRVHYQGDIAHLYQEGQFLNDDFWNGLEWDTGIKALSKYPIASAQVFQLRILPLPVSFPMYLEKSGLLQNSKNGSFLSLDKFEAIPQYHLALTVDRKRDSLAPDDIGRKY